MKARRTRTRSIFSILLAMALIVSMMPTFAFAKNLQEDKVVWAYSGETGQDGEPIRSGAKWMRVNDKYYYDFLKGTGGMDTADNYSKEDFYKAMIAGHLDKNDPECTETMPYDSTNEFSALGQWAALAAKIFKNYEQYISAKIGAPDSFNQRPLPEKDIKKYLGSKDDIGGTDSVDDDYQWTSTKLQTASNLKTIYDEIKNGDTGLGSDEADQYIDLTKLNDSTTRDVVYKIAKRDTYDYGEQYYALAFYDFKLSPILSKFPYITAAEGYENIESAYEASKPGVYYYEGEGENEKISYFKNESEKDNSVSLNFSKSRNESLSNTMGKSESYSFTEATGYTNSISIDISVPIFGECKHDRTWSFNFTTNQTFGTSQSETKAQTDSESMDSTSGVTLPGHTAAQIKSSSNTMQIQLKYACPVALSYKVYMGVHQQGFELLGPDNNRYEAIFGTDSSDDKKTLGTAAQENLYLRAVEHVDQNGYEKGNSNCKGCMAIGTKSVSFGANGIEWKNIYDKENTYDIINWLTNNYVMSYTGGDYDYNATSQNTQLGAIVPLYDLYGITLAEYTQFGDIKIDDNGNIKIINDENFKDAYDLHDFRMAPGEIFYPRSLTLAPYNRYMVDYYGFKTALGSWKKVKKVQDGENVKWELDESGDTNNVAKIVSDEVSGYQRIDAGNEEGEVYFQYFINETTSNYTSVENDEPVKNDDISRPVIKIKVQNKPFKGTVRFREDNFKAEIGTPYNLKSVFDPAVYDENGNLVNRAVEWELSPATEEKLDNGDLTFDKITGDITFNKEGKYTVIAGTGEATKAEYTIVAQKTKLRLDAFSKTITTGKNFTLTLTDSNVENPDPRDYTWSSSNPEVATVDIYGRVSGLTVGTATITVDNGKGSSATCEVTVENAEEERETGGGGLGCDSSKIVLLSKSPANSNKLLMSTADQRNLLLASKYLRIL